MTRIYMSVEDGYHTKGPESYRSSRTIIDRLKTRADLFLVTPKDYNLEKGTIARAYRAISSTQIEQVLGEHEPTGDLFIIYGDGSPENPGIDFGRREYAFLRQIRDAGNFRHFINSPEGEESALKDGLVGLSRAYPNIVAKTVFYEGRGQLESLLSMHGYLVMKPIFGCAGAGVEKIETTLDLERFGSEEHIKRSYVFQEPLQAGAELRVLILDGKFIGAPEFSNYQPWFDEKRRRTTIGTPSDDQISWAKQLSKELGLTLSGVDYLNSLDGSLMKVFEVNGTGSGLISRDKQGNLIYDFTPKFIDFILGKCRQD